MKITLKETPKLYTKDTHRVVPPEETLKRVEKLLPDIGVTRVAEISGLDQDRHTCVLGYPSRLAAGRHLCSPARAPRRWKLRSG